MRFVVKARLGGENLARAAFLSFSTLLNYSFGPV